jgi:hypothetical protein
VQVGRISYSSLIFFDFVLFVYFRTTGFWVSGKPSAARRVQIVQFARCLRRGSYSSICSLLTARLCRFEGMGSLWWGSLWWGISTMRLSGRANWMSRYLIRTESRGSRFGTCTTHNRSPVSAQPPASDPTPSHVRLLFGGGRLVSSQVLPQARAPPPPQPPPSRPSRCLGFVPNDIPEAVGRGHQGHHARGTHASHALPFHADPRRCAVAARVRARLRCCMQMTMRISPLRLSTPTPPRTEPRVVRDFWPVSSSLVLCATFGPSPPPSCCARLLAHLVLPRHDTVTWKVL